MKTLYFAPVLLLLVFTGCAATTPSAPENETLTLYTYESLNADYGLLPLILPQFAAEQKLNGEVHVVTFPDAGAMLNQLIAERDHPVADVVMGLDNLQLPDIKKYNLLTPFTPQNAKDIEASAKLDEEFTLTPFDYGYVAFVYDSEKIDFPAPVSLSDLTKPEYKGKIVIEQPGLSSPGTQLVAWVNSTLGDAAPTFWNNFAPNVLTVAPDWNTAYYTLFLGEQAPIVLSYLSSPAYHIDQEQTDRYKVVPLTDGYLAQVEGVGIVNGTNNPSLAEDFVDYVITPEVQANIATTQWMFPVRKVELPEAYSQLPKAEPELVLTQSQIHDQLPSWIEVWQQAFSK